MPVNEPNADAPDSLAAQLAELKAEAVSDTRVGRARARLLANAERATTWGPLAPVAEIAWQTARRDSAIGGNVLAAALAYRIFIWLLPLALVLVLGLGWLADSSSVLNESGLSGYVATSVEAATENVRGWARLTGLVVGVFVLLYETYVLLRAIRVVTAIAWGVPVRRARNPARDTVVFMAGVIGFAAAASWGSAIRRQLDFPLDVMAWVASWGLVSVIFLGFAWWLLPHAAAHWTEVAPGAALVGVAVILLGLFNWLILYPWLSEKEETYGVLGVAAGLLFGFFLIGRTIELAASLNAVLAERRAA
jgi:membrane protein